MLNNVPNMLTVVIVQKTGWAAKVGIAAVFGALGFGLGSMFGVAVGQEMSKADVDAAQDQYEKTINRVTAEAEQDKQRMKEYEAEVAELRREKTWTGK